MTVVERMQELLEAERANVVCMDQMAFYAKSKEANRFFFTVRNNDADFCEQLHGLILRRDADPTTAMGELSEHVLALPTEKERNELIIRALSWVVSKIEEIPQEEMNEEELAFFRRMHQTHMENIRMCSRLPVETE